MKPVASAILISPEAVALATLDAAAQAAGLSGIDPNQFGLTLVTWDAVEAPGTVANLSLGRPQGALHRVAARLSRHMITRNLLRFTPLDPNTTFWRAFRGNTEAMQCANSADVAIAVERDAIMTVWKVARRRGDRPGRAILGLPAGLAHLRLIHDARLDQKPSALDNASS
ncbi:MAG: hypothetical protein ABIW81_08605 [Terrimesophilobacter sp.]